MLKIILLRYVQNETNTKSLQLLRESEGPANKGAPTGKSLEGNILEFW